jgi:D-3-phosphoglycerate dehydrogenase
MKVYWTDMAKTMTSRAQILVADPIAPDGIRVLEEYGDVRAVDGLTSDSPDLAGAQALIVRSQTKVTAALIGAAPELRVIGRAGIGVDNVDVEAASRRGIVVVNAPTSVVIAAAEHTLALILALCRRIPQAHQSVSGGRWERSRFVGTEIRGKTVGIVGLGNIGAEVARRLAAFEAKVVGSDPFVSAEYAARLGVQLLSLDELIEVADLITVHVPLTASTRNLIGARQFARLKPGARLVNCARGGVVDEAALVDALEAGTLAGAALDVFVQEPPQNPALLHSERVVLTPHLGASTEEAQVAASVEVAEQVIAVLDGHPVRYAVNAPAILPESLATLGPYVALGETLGYLAAQLTTQPIQSVEISYYGQLAEEDTAAVRSAVVKGVLKAAVPDHVNLMNALLLARNRGLQVVELRCATAQESYANLLAIQIKPADGLVRELAGTVVGPEVHLVRVDTYHVDVVLTDGFLLFVQHIDRPGVVGRIGTLLGDADVNISAMQVGRLERRGHAMMILAIDESIPEVVLNRLIAENAIQAARLVQL